MKKTKKITPLKAIVFTVLIIYSISMIFMLCWGFLTSLKSAIDFTDFKNHFGLPNPAYSSDEMLFSNYVYIWQNSQLPVSSYEYYSLFGPRTTPLYYANFLTMLINTLYYAAFLAFMQALVCMTMGYMTAKYKNKVAAVIVGTVYALMALPIVGSQPAEISLLMDLGVYNTYAGMFIHKFNYGGIYFLVFNAFFMAISDTYTEAAEIDGASQFRVYTSIIIPLAAKMLLMVYLLYFITAWNDYNTILVYYPSFPTLSYGVWAMAQNSHGDSVPQKFAGTMILTIPLLLLFFSFRNYIMGNVSTGGVKE